MKTVVILHCLKNNDQKRSAYVQYKGSFLSSNEFVQRLVEFIPYHEADMLGALPIYTWPIFKVTKSPFQVT